VPQLCPSLHCTFPPSVCVLLLLKQLTQSQHTHIHIHTHSLSLSLPFLSPSCSGRVTNNRSPLYLLLHRTISDRRALVLSAILPSHSPNSHVDHSSIVHPPTPKQALQLFPPSQPPLTLFRVHPTDPYSPSPPCLGLYTATCHQHLVRDLRCKQQVQWLPQ